MYDIADLYKAELSIPVAFKTAAMHPDDIGSATRKNMRDALYDLSVMKCMVEDITDLFSMGIDQDESFGDDLKLWDEKNGEVAAGRQYSDGSEG